MKNKTMKIYAVGFNSREYYDHNDTFYAKLEDAVKDYIDRLKDNGMDYVKKEAVIHEVKLYGCHVTDKYHIVERRVIL